MAAGKPEVLLPQVAHRIITTFQVPDKCVLGPEAQQFRKQPFPAEHGATSQQSEQQVNRKSIWQVPNLGHISYSS